jgi:hemoglobin
MSTKHDINNKTDIELMVRTFYANLLQEESIQPLFANTDFEAHVPHMIDFWSFVLLNEDGYKTNVMERHFHLPLKETHFELWLKHFNHTINNLFEGERADLALQRASSIAYMMKMKFQQMGKLN